MPHVIGEFISARFYEGQLGTDTQRADRDELFASTMAFIDTAELPARQRRERYPRADEPWPPKSYVNDTEAQLIAELVAYYDARKSDWVVIVPFSAHGFFSDVRWSNVAFSRARRRLIMTGDLSTLLNASDPGFRSMMTALHDHLRRRGDIRKYREISALLAREAGR